MYDICYNQLRLKLLYKRVWDHSHPRINLRLNKYMLKHLNKKEVIEDLHLLELITNSKTIISSFKKNFKNVNISYSSILRSNDIYYFLNILKTFYIPMILRRSTKIILSFDKKHTVSFYINQIKDLPLMSEIYYKHTGDIKVSLYFPYIEKKKKSKKKKVSTLLTSYYLTNNLK